MFVEFRKSNGDRCFVNTHQIEYVREKSKDTTVLYFGQHTGGDNRIIVDESYADVKQKISKG